MAQAPHQDQVASVSADPPSQGSGAGRLLTALALAAIAALGLFMRWDRLQYAQFNFDQVWSLNRAYEFVAKGDFPLFGMASSFGTAQGPWEIYVLALPAALSRDPLVATAYVGLLQMLAVLGTYFFVARYYGRGAGLAAAALYAANAWAIVYGRRIWTPDVMPLFVLLFFASLYAAVVRRHRYAFAWACALLVVLFLTHPSAVAYAPLLLLALLWRRPGWGPLALGLALGSLAAAPYLYYESQHGYTSLARYLTVPASTEGGNDLAGLNWLVSLASDRGLREGLATTFGDNYIPPLVGPLDGLATALLALGLAVCLWRLATRSPWRGRPAGEGWEAYLLLLLWFVLPALVTLRHPFVVQPHYLIFAWPVQFILIGLSLAGAVNLAARLTAGGRAWGSAGAALVVLALSASQLSYSWAYLENVVRLGEREPWTAPLGLAQQAAAQLRSLRAELGPLPIYAYAFDSQYRCLSYLAGPDLALTPVTPPSQLVLPRDPSAGALFLLALNDFGQKPLGFVVTDDDGPLVRGAHDLGFVDLPERAVRHPAGRVYFRFLYLPPAAGAQVVPSFQRPPQPPRLPSGLGLVGYKYVATARPGDRIALSLLWDLPDQAGGPAPPDYNLFVHVVDRTGRTVVGRDAELAQYVLAGDAAYSVTYHELALPPDVGPGLVWLEVGAYERATRTEVRWQDAGGKQLDSSYKVGPIKIAPPANAPAPQTKADFLFGEALALVGYDLSPAQATVGGKVDITLHWQARAKPAGDYAVSVQVLDETGQLVAQHDSTPVGGNYPTSYWAAGETVLDQHSVALPKDAKPGAYLVVVVVYSQQTQQRLSVDGADSASLATVQVSIGK